MNTDGLDRSYTELCEALGRVGEDKSTLMLATLSLALLAREDDAQLVLDLIAQAERLARA
jgi:hypothetical protein